MGLLGQLWGRSSPRPQSDTRSPYRRVALEVERLEDRTMLDASATLAGGTLAITGNRVAYDTITVSLDPIANQLVVGDNGVETARFANAAVTAINITGAAHFNVVRVAANVFQPATITGGPATNFLFAGSGPTNLVAGPGINRLAGGAGNDTLNGMSSIATTFFADGGINSDIGGPGTNLFFGGKDRDVIVPDNVSTARNFDFRVDVTPGPLNDFLGLVPTPTNNVTLTPDDVGRLLARAAAATASDDGIVAIVDRSGRILGVRVEGKVDPAITGDVHKLVFSIDGAVALARTGAFFASNQAPLTSRTIEFISQTTITQREVQSDPSITDVNSPFRGPGFVAPISIGGHFPPGVERTPQVDLFQIEGTNRDTTFHPGPSMIAGAPDSFFLPDRFNIDPRFVRSDILQMNQMLAPPDSYGLASGLEPMAQPRGIGTLPGGVPIIKNGQVVGGIGVFFPGKTGFADEENAHLQGATFDGNRPDRSLEAEFVAITALGGNLAVANPGTIGNNGVDGDLVAGQNVVVGGLAPVAGLALPFGRIDLVGITLPIYGPEGDNGPKIVLDNAQGLGIGQGDPNSHAVLNLPTGPYTGLNAPLLMPGPTNQLVSTTAPPGGGQPITTRDQFGNPLTVFLSGVAAPNNLLASTPVPEGFIVEPHDAPDGSVTADQVRTIIAQGVNQAVQTRAAIRLPLDSTTKMVLSVTDKAGDVLGLFRMPDSTIFSIDVAVAKARNVSYYANPAELQPIDQLPGVPPGTALTNRTFRFLSEPFYPEGIDGTLPAPFSVLLNGGSDLRTGLNTGAPLPSAAFATTVMGHDAFFPQTNFHDPFNIANQNGIVFFPGSVPLYTNGNLIGGEGTSGDGVDQDDVVTFSAKQGFDTPANVLRADQVFVRDVRLPYQKFNRQPLEP